MLINGDEEKNMDEENEKKNCMIFLCDIMNVILFIFTKGFEAV